MPFVATAAIGGLISSTMSFTWVPSGLLAVLLWALIVQIPLFVAEAALIVMALQVQKGQPPGVSTAYLSAFAVASQYVAGSLLIGAVLLLGGLSIIGIVAGLFLFARWGLFGPIVVMEQQSMGDALRASWRLVKGRTHAPHGHVAGGPAGGARCEFPGPKHQRYGSLGARIVFFHLGTSRGITPGPSLRAAALPGLPQAAVQRPARGATADPTTLGVERRDKRRGPIMNGASLCVL